MIPSWPLNVASASGVPPYIIDRHQLARNESSKIKSPCHIPTFSSQLIDEQRLSTPRAVHRPALSTCPISKVHLQTHSIMASKCISKFARLQPPSSHNHSLQVHLQTRSITASKCISKPARWRPPSASPNSLDNGLQVHLQTPSIAISECISKFTRSRPPSVCANTVDYYLQVHLQTSSITASECISEFTRSSFSGPPQIALKHRLQPVQIYRMYMGSYIDT